MSTSVLTIIHPPYSLSAQRIILSVALILLVRISDYPLLSLTTLHHNHFLTFNCPDFKSTVRRWQFRPSSTYYIFVLFLYSSSIRVHFLPSLQHLTTCFSSWLTNQETSHHIYSGRQHFPTLRRGYSDIPHFALVRLLGSYLLFSRRRRRLGGRRIESRGRF
jgi:hypothetical protein